MGSNKKRKRLIYLAFVEPGPARINQVILFDELQSSFLSGNSLLWKRERCQGHSPLISTSSDQLKNVRTSTISPSHAYTREGGFDGDAVNDVGSDQEFQS